MAPIIPIASSLSQNLGQINSGFMIAIWGMLLPFYEVETKEIIFNVSSIIDLTEKLSIWLYFPNNSHNIL